MKLNPAMSRSRSGFTLIELLTVIAIIGILAAILIPTVGAVRAKARQVQCNSKLRDWGRVLLLYAGEHKNQYAIRDGNGYWFQIATNASDTVYATYFGLKRGDLSGMAQCPDQATISGGSSLVNTHYLLTRPSKEIGDAPLTANLVPITKIRTPSKFVMMVERAYGADGNPSGGADYEDMQLKNTAASARKNAQDFRRHSKKLNTLWADGHVSQTNYSGDVNTSWNEAGDGTNYNFRRWLALNN